MYDRTCVVCGRAFAANHGAQRLCGPECRRERDRQHLARCLANATPGPLAKQCVICGTAFLAGKTEARPRKSKTCSQACQKALHLRHSLEHQAKRHQQGTRQCKACGGTFHLVDRPRQVTCSEKCMLHQKRDRQGRRRERQNASGQRAAVEARRRASGYMRQYKRQWRRRRNEEKAKLEMLILTAVIGRSSDIHKGDTDGQCN